MKVPIIIFTVLLKEFNFMFGGLGTIASLPLLIGTGVGSQLPHLPPHHLPVEKSIPALERINNEQVQSGGELATFRQLMNYIKAQESPYFSRKIKREVQQVHTNQG